MLTQYKSHSLDRHVTQTWRMSTMLGNYVAPVPAQQRVGKHWYLGSADAIYQSLNLLRDEQPDIVVVVGADHVYRMDFSQMVDQHIESGAACTVAAIRQPIELADQFGVIDVQPDDPSRIRDFLEKPTDPTGLPDNPARGARLDGQLRLRRRRPGRGGDRGRDDDRAPSTTWAATSCRSSYAARRPASTTTRTTWCPARPTATAATGATSGRSAPTTPPTWTSSRPLPVFNLYNFALADLHLLRAAAAGQARAGRRRLRAARPRRPCSRPVSSSAAAPSCRSVLSPAVSGRAAAPASRAVLLHGVRVGEGAVVRNAILDKNVVVPPGAQIGVDPEADQARGFVVEDGLTVLGKDQQFPG